MDKQEIRFTEAVHDLDLEQAIKFLAACQMGYAYKAYNLQIVKNEKRHKEKGT